MEARGISVPPNEDVQLTFLHLYHHLTIGMIWGFLLNDGVGNGAAFFGAFLNSAVHALMYFHYFVTSFGINNPLKKYLTQVQMAQFAMCIMHAMGVVALSSFPKPWAILQLCYHCTLLGLFLHFYIGQFVSKKKVK